MILLDTDHATVLKYRDTERCQRLMTRLAMVADDEIGTTIITVEEQMRGWLASIAKERKVSRQIAPYRELVGLFDFFSDFEILSLEEKAVAIFDQFSRIRIGTMDRKIAAIALANDALLLPANARISGRFPGFDLKTGWNEP